MDVTNITRRDLVIGEAIYKKDTITMALSGTAGSVTDTTTYPVADQDTKTEKVTIDGGTEQTVTFSVTATTAAVIASELNDQLTGASVAVVGGQVVITSDSTGAGSSVAIGTGTADLTWDTPVAGTGKTGAILKGTLLARNSVSKKLTTYSDSGSNGENEPVAVITFDLTFTASGDKAARVLKDAKVVQELLVKHDDSTAIDTLVIDKLIKNSGIVPVSARDFTVQDNQ